MARTKMAKIKQMSIGRGMARGLPRTTSPRKRLQPMTFVRTYVRDRSPPARDTPTKDVEIIEEKPPPTVGGTKPTNGPLLPTFLWQSPAEIGAGQIGHPQADGGVGT